MRLRQQTRQLVTSFARFYSMLMIWEERDRNAGLFVDVGTKL